MRKSTKTENIVSAIAQVIDSAVDDGLPTVIDCRVINDIVESHGGDIRNKTPYIKVLRERGYPIEGRRGNLGGYKVSPKSRPDVIGVPMINETYVTYDIARIKNNFNMSARRMSDIRDANEAIRHTLSTIFSTQYMRNHFPHFDMSLAADRLTDVLLDDGAFEREFKQMIQSLVTV